MHKAESMERGAGAMGRLPGYNLDLYSTVRGKLAQIFNQGKNMLE